MTEPQWFNSEIQESHWVLLDLNSYLNPAQFNPCKASTFPAIKTKKYG